MNWIYACIIQVINAQHEVPRIPVPFQQRLRMTFEFGHGNQSPGYMSNVAYWYQDEPQASDSRIGSVERRSPANDRLEPISFMAHLFELERVGLLAEARERCLYYAEKYAENAEASMYVVRAAAYAEAGRFSEAIAALHEAIDLAASMGSKESVAELERRLEGYKQGRPYRERHLPPEEIAP